MNANLGFVLIFGMIALAAALPVQHTETVKAETSSVHREGRQFGFGGSSAGANSFASGNSFGGPGGFGLASSNAFASANSGGFGGLGGSFAGANAAANSFGGGFIG